jgi:hypothetical protein
VKRFQKIFTDDPLQQRLQDSIANSFNAFETLPQLDSVLVENITLFAGGDNQVNHNLKRKLIGWQIIRQNAAAIVYESDTTNTQPSSVIILKTTIDCTVSFIFF